MENKKGINFFLGIVAIILGWTLFKQFDFENLKFKHTGLAIIYIVTFVFSICVLIRNYKNSPKK
jgi:predicted ferric reductase